MKTKTFWGFLFIGLCTFPWDMAVADLTNLPPKYNEAELKKRYDAFLLDLDYVQVAADYPKAVKDLLSGDAERQAKAIETLSATGEPCVLPWIVPFLDSESSSLRICAGYSIERVISGCALKRRDRTKLDNVVLRPLEAGDFDLRPLAWIALKMFRKPDDGNTHAYAASITRYLEMKEFEDELRRALKSRHPAVSEKAKWALESIGFATDKTSQDPGANGSQPFR